MFINLMTSIKNFVIGVRASSQALGYNHRQMEYLTQASDARDLKRRIENMNAPSIIGYDAPYSFRG